MATKWTCEKCRMEQWDPDHVGLAKCRICGEWTNLMHIRRPRKCTCGYEECPYCGDEY